MSGNRWMDRRSRETDGVDEIALLINKHNTQKIKPYDIIIIILLLLLQIFIHRVSKKTSMM